MSICSCCILVLPNGKLVFQRRTADAPVSAHKLDLFGGHREPRESREATIRRELAEETSLEPEHMGMTYLGEVDSPVSDGQMYVYKASIKSDQFRVYEGEQEETYSLDEILHRHDVDPDTRAVLEAFKHILK